MYLKSKNNVKKTFIFKVLSLSEFNDLVKLIGCVPDDILWVLGGKDSHRYLRLALFWDFECKEMKIECTIFLRKNGSPQVCHLLHHP